MPPKLERTIVHIGVELEINANVTEAVVRESMREALKTINEQMPMYNPMRKTVRREITSYRKIGTR